LVQLIKSFKHDIFKNIKGKWCCKIKKDARSK
jgi:hypothetical protein